MGSNLLFLQMFIKSALRVPQALFAKLHEFQLAQVPQQSFQPGNSTSTIHVSVSDNSKRSYSFQGFETIFLGPWRNVLLPRNEPKLK